PRRRRPRAARLRDLRHHARNAHVLSIPTRADDARAQPQGVRPSARCGAQDAALSVSPPSPSEVPVQQRSLTPQNSTVVRSKNTLRLARAALQTAYFCSDKLGTSVAERLFTTPRRYPRPERERSILATARQGRVQVTLR